MCNVVICSKKIVDCKVVDLEYDEPNIFNFTDCAAPFVQTSILKNALFYQACVHRILLLILKLER